MGQGRVRGKVALVIVIALPTMRIGHAFEWKIDLLVIVIELNLKFNKLYKRTKAQAQHHQAERLRPRQPRDYTTDAKRANCQFSDKQKPLTGLASPGHSTAWGVRP